jgi:hypothetical protein
MDLRRAFVLAAAALLFAPVARSGHEIPVYPSYYPHEIEIAAVEPQAAGALMRAGKLHAYAGGAPDFGGPAPDAVGSVAPLGSWLIVRLNPDSAFAREAEKACTVVAAVVREAAAAGGSAVAHPYPVTPLHGDYLHHADLAEAARARLAGSDAAPDGSLKLRAVGTLAQSLVRPEWRAAGADWDAVVQEVDVARLVAAATTQTNAWLGPRWTRAGWFHAYLLLRDAIADPEAGQRIDADASRLQSGNITDPAERVNLERDVVRRLAADCRAAVAGYTVRREYFNASFSDGIENIAHDAFEGFASPMFLRTVKLKDFPWNGWLKLGAAAPPNAAWNPVGGFTDGFGRLMWFAVGDPAAIPSPYDHGWVLNRISEVEEAPRR